MRTSPAIWTVRVLVAALMVIVIEFGIDHLYVNDAFVPQMNVPVLMLTVLICAGLIYIMYRLWKSPSSLDRKTTMQGWPDTHLYVRHSFWELMRYSLTVGFFWGIVLGACVSSIFVLPTLIEGLSHYEIELVYFSAKIEAIALISGMLTGFVFGAFNGLLISWLTRQFFLPPKDASGYQGTVGWICASMSLLLGISVLGVGTIFQGELHGALLPVPFAIPFIPFIAWSVSQKVCRWYTSEGYTASRDVISDSSL